MGCRCGGRSRATAARPTPNDPAGIMEQYKYLRPHQVTARLEVFKRGFCQNCETRYQCNYQMYLNCTKRPH